jgi:hypothetical protein
MFDLDGELPTSPSGLIVGECRGPNTDGRTPLFPHPTGSTAGRLLQYAQMTHRDYLGRLERVNQCVDEWSDVEAMARLREIVGWLMMQQPTPRVLLLGRQVQRIWCVSSQSNFGSEVWCHDGTELQVAWIAHPNGLSRVYNDQDTRVKAGRAIRWCAGLEEML